MQYLIDLMKTTFETSLDKKDIQYVFAGKPKDVAKMPLEKGFLYIEPISTDVNSLTTGIRDEEQKRVRVVIAKSMLNKFNLNAQKETGQQFLMRVLEGNDSSTANTLITSSIRYIIRNNFRTWGISQVDMVINYDTEDIEDAPLGTAQGNIEFTQIDSVTQPLL